ncbi:MAG: hypothetical protein R3C56_34085 [Pirellulaceae bacterium]
MDADSRRTSLNAPHDDLIAMFNPDARSASSQCHGTSLDRTHRHRAVGVDDASDELV